MNYFHIYELFVNSTCVVHNSNKNLDPEPYRAHKAINTNETYTEETYIYIFKTITGQYFNFGCGCWYKLLKMQASNSK